MSGGMGALRIVRVRDAYQNADVALPAEVTIAEGLASLGIQVDGITSAVVDQRGVRPNLSSPVADSIHDGEVLTIIDLSRPAATPNSAHGRRRPGISKRAAPIRRSAESWVLGAGWFLLAVIIGLACLSQSTILWIGPRTGGLLVGSLMSLVFTAVSYTASSNVVRASTQALAGVALILTLLWSVVLLFNWPTVTYSNWLLGLVPLSLRGIVALSIRVPSEQFIDVDSNSTLAWAVRPQPARKQRAPKPSAVNRLVTESGARIRSVTVSCSILAPVALGTLLIWPAEGTLEKVSRSILAVLTVLILALAPAQLPSIVSRVGPWISALVSAPLAAAIILACWPGSAAYLTVGSLALGLVGLASTVLVSRQARSLGLSRLGDGLLGLCVVIIPPLAIAASGMINLLRSGVS